MGERKDCTISKKLILLRCFISLGIFCSLGGKKKKKKLSKRVRPDKITCLPNRERMVKYTSSSPEWSIFSLEEKLDICWKDVLRETKRGPKCAAQHLDCGNYMWSCIVFIQAKWGVIIKYSAFFCNQKFELYLKALPSIRLFFL